MEARKRGEADGHPEDALEQPQLDGIREEKRFFDGRAQLATAGEVERAEHGNSTFR
jgi:hypothetical protein